MNAASASPFPHQAAPVAIAVAGAGGRLGRLLQAVWPADGPDPAPRWSARRPVAEMCVWDIGAAPPPAHLCGADVLLCLAGRTGRTGGGCRDDANMALAALSAADAAGIGTVILCSSIAVYGRAADIDGGAEEDAPLRPVSPYGRSKLLMERSVIRNRRRSGAGCARAVMLRIGNVIAADAVSAAIAAARARGAQVALDSWPGGATASRSVIGPVGLALTLAALARRAAAGDILPPVLNLSQPGAVAMADLCGAAAVDWRPQAPPAAALPRATMDTGRLQALLPSPLAVADADGLIAEWRAAGGLQ